MSKVYNSFGYDLTIQVYPSSQTDPVSVQQAHELYEQCDYFGWYAVRTTRVPDGRISIESFDFPKQDLTIALFSDRDKAQQIVELLEKESGRNDLIIMLAYYEIL